MEKGVGDVDFNILVAGVDHRYIPGATDASVVVHGGRPIFNFDDKQRSDNEVEPVDFQFLKSGGVEYAHRDRMEYTVEHAIVVAERRNFDLKRTGARLAHIEGE